MPFNKPINRRRFCKIGIQAALCSLFPTSAISSLGPSAKDKRHLSLFNMHTGQDLDVCYYAHGRHQPEALKKINYILRDHRTQEIKPIHKGLLELLHSISAKVGSSNRIHIISGYRSPKTNAELRKKSSRVVKNSLHMKGQAADIRIPNCETSWLRDVCIQLKAGGVGYYRKSDFVHVDIGRIRQW